jgi:catechol 2,3-dioxygenase-like lactoylglutathione lyase family enzyme
MAEPLNVERDRMVHAVVVPETLRVVLNVSQFDEVVAFYREVLGLPAVGGWDRGPADRGALLEVAYGGVVEIVGHGSAFTTPRYTDMALAIELEDRQRVDEWCRRLRSKGVLVSEPVARSWGHYSMSLRDPVGVEVVPYADLTDE